MRKLILFVLGMSVAAFVAVGMPAQAAAQGRGLQPEDLHRLRSVGQARISTNGEKILFTVQSREGEKGTSSQIRVWDIASGQSSVASQWERKRLERPLVSRWSMGGLSR